MRMRTVERADSKAKKVQNEAGPRITARPRAEVSLLLYLDIFLIIMFRF